MPGGGLNGLVLRNIHRDLSPEQLLVGWHEILAIKHHRSEIPLFQGVALEGAEEVEAPDMIGPSRDCDPEEDGDRIRVSSIIQAKHSVECARARDATIFEHPL
jgi:hypothetical protein